LLPSLSLLLSPELDLLSRWKRRILNGVLELGTGRTVTQETVVGTNRESLFDFSISSTKSLVLHLGAGLSAWNSADWQGQR
jgi:hypothetical protein